MNINELKNILSDSNWVEKAFKSNIKYGEYDSWNSNFDSMANKGWHQAINYVLKLIEKGE